MHSELRLLDPEGNELERWYPDGDLVLLPRQTAVRLRTGEIRTVAGAAMCWTESKPDGPTKYVSAFVTVGVEGDEPHPADALVSVAYGADPPEWAEAPAATEVEHAPPASPE